MADERNTHFECSLQVSRSSLLGPRDRDAMDLPVAVLIAVSAYRLSMLMPCSLCLTRLEMLIDVVHGYFSCPWTLS